MSRPAAPGLPIKLTPPQAAPAPQQGAVVDPRAHLRAVMQANPRQPNETDTVYRERIKSILNGSP